MMTVKALSVSFWVFLVSLNSYYFYELGAAVPPLLAALVSWVWLLALLAINRGVLYRAVYDSRYFVFVSFSMIFFSVLVGLLKYADVVNLRALVFYILGLGVGVFVCYLIRSERSALATAMRWTLIVHLLAFFLQVFLFYLGIAEIDYLEPVTGESQRSLGGQYYIGSFRLFRGVGLFNEPGTFAAFVFVMYVTQRVLEGDSFETIKVGVLDLVVLLAIALSFSTLGFALLLAYFSLYLIKGRWAPLLAMAPLALSLFYLGWSYYFKPRFMESTGETALDYRQRAISDYLSEVVNDPTIIFFGYGGFTDRNALYESSYSWSDMTLIVNYFMTFGLIGTLIFVSILLVIRRSFTIVALALLFGLTKLHPGTMFFWFIFSLILFKSDVFFSRTTFSGRRYG